MGKRIRKKPFIVFVEVEGRRLRAKIDTGATRSSIDRITAAECGLGPIFDEVKTEGERRDVIEFPFRFRNKTYRIDASLSNRRKREAKVLLGMDFVEESGLADHLRRWLQHT
jgi:hypothetical protein